MWDLPVRLFHWSTVLLVAFAWYSAEVMDDGMEWHMWSGYTLLTLVLFRILWGFWGGRHARFGDFLHNPSAVTAYLRTLHHRDSGYHPGHNPLGGWMVLLMLAALFVQAVSGLFSADDIFNEGPLAARVSSAAVEWFTELHEVNFNLLLALIGVHLAAIAFYRIWKEQNLVAAMITGRGSVEEPEDPPTREPGTARALLLLAVSALAVAGLVNLG